VDINLACDNFVKWSTDLLEQQSRIDIKADLQTHLLERHTYLCWLSNQDPIPTLSNKEILNLSRTLALIDQLRLPQAQAQNTAIYLNDVVFGPDNIALATLRNMDPLTLKRLKLVLEKNSPQIEKEAVPAGSKEPDTTGNGKTGADKQGEKPVADHISLLDFIKTKLEKKSEAAGRKKRLKNS